MTELPPITAVEGWPAGSSAYPLNLDVYVSRSDGLFAKEINDITMALQAIEATLGTSPAGGSATVKAALSTLNAGLVGLTSAHGDLASQVAALQSVPGPANSFFRHVQSTPQEVWTITHTLGRRPAVTVVDSAGSPVEGDIDYPSTSVVTITFSSAFAGEALLS